MLNSKKARGKVVLRSVDESRPLQLSYDGNMLRCTLRGIFSTHIAAQTYSFTLFKNNKGIQDTDFTPSPSAELGLMGDGIYHASLRVKEATGAIHKPIYTARYHYIKGHNPSFFPHLTIDEIEMTNICNLSCTYCCTPTTSYPRGFIDDTTMLMALSWAEPGQFLGYHRHGEALLHKQLEKYICWGVAAGIKPFISTNGVLLTEQRLASLYQSGLRHLIVSGHTEKSIAAFRTAVSYFQNRGIKLINYMDRHIKDDAAMFITLRLIEPPNDTLFTEKAQVKNDFPDLLDIPKVHSWSGNVPGTRNTNTEEHIRKRMVACRFIRQGQVNMRWDGTIVGCCHDSENDIQLGHISQFSDVRIEIDKYRLCEHCDI